jgi:chromosome segregation ATPase
MTTTTVSYINRVFAGEAEEIRFAIGRTEANIDHTVVDIARETDHLTVMRANLAELETAAATTSSAYIAQLLAERAKTVRFHVGQTEERLAALRERLADATARLAERNSNLAELEAAMDDHVV